MTSNAFTIDDAFASDEEDTIRTYGSTADSRMSPFRAKTRPGSGRAMQNASQSTDKGGVTSVPTDKISSEALLRAEDDFYDDDSVNGSIGSVSLGKVRGITNIIHMPQSQYAESLVESNVSVKSFPNSKSWWKHPKVKENWKLVVASFMLVLVGMGLIAGGICVSVLPVPGVEQIVFYVAGAICFIPGAYHVVYIYLAVRGRQGFNFYNLPLVK